MSALSPSGWDDFVVPPQARRGQVTLNLHDHLSAYIPRRPAAYLRISSDRFGLEAGVDRQQQDADDTRTRLRWPGFTKVYKENDTSAFKKRKVIKDEGSVDWVVVRPQFRQLLADLASGVIDGVIDWSCWSPPGVPKARTGTPSRSARDGLSVVRGRRPGVSELGRPGSSQVICTGHQVQAERGVVLDGGSGGAGPCPQSTVGRPSAGARMIGTSPAGPFRCGSTTCSTKPAATAASKALPPPSSTAIAHCEASQWVDETMPKVPCRVGRVVNMGAVLLQKSVDRP